MTGTGSDHPLPWEGQPYSIKRHGVTITNCDTEPVQTPGCIQAHVALLVLRPGDLTILRVSENSEALLGHVPEELLGRPMAAAVGDHGEARLRDFLAGEPTVRVDVRYWLTRVALPDRGSPIS